MQRDLVLIAAVVLTVMVNCAGCKVCNSTDIRNDPKQFEKLRNCTIVAGYVKILLFDLTNKTEDVYENYSFPELTEILDFLVLFRLDKITSLGKLFPNLRVIRGKKLFASNTAALVIFRLNSLQEIGLSSLRHIDNGDVVVEHCDQLCFVHSVNWEALGVNSSSQRLQSEKDKCPVCPKACPSSCWNATVCQITHDDSCHELCLGCTSPNSTKDCQACRFYNHNGTCVKYCPKDTYPNKSYMECFTKKECEELEGGKTWVIFDSLCVNSCPVGYIESNATCKNCTNLTNYTKTCDGSMIKSTPDLAKYDCCTHINGSLEISLSEYSSPTNFSILSQIKEIDGILKISRSSIKSLSFFKNLRSIGLYKSKNQGVNSLFIYENENLEELFDFPPNVSLEVHGTVTFNNNPQLCFSKIKDLNVTYGQVDWSSFEFTNGERATCFEIQLELHRPTISSTNATITWDYIDNDAVAFTVFYIETRGRNLTAFGSKDVCSDGGWRSVTVTNNSVQLSDLNPYTNYSFYINVNKITSRMRSPMHSFKTLPDDPTEVVDFSAEAISDHTVRLTWKPPKFANGDLNHYHVLYFKEKDNQRIIEERDYCHYRHVEPEVARITTTQTPVNSVDCVCEQETQFLLLGKHLECSYLNRIECSEMYYQTVVEKFTLDSLIADDPISKKSTVRKRYSNGDVTIPVNDALLNSIGPSHYKIKGLAHFSSYTFFITACNLVNISRCGPVSMNSARTKKDDNADWIHSVQVKVNDNELDVLWDEPSAVNSMLVAYDVEYKRKDLKHSKQIFECITSRMFKSNGSRFKTNLSPGVYSVRVRAISLAGPGKYSKHAIAIIMSPDGSPLWTWLLIIIACLVLVALLLIILRHKKRSIAERISLIPSVNPDYGGYVEDDWEVDRKDVEFQSEIGQGTFGMVYQGVLKTTGMPCAIKTINHGVSVGTMRSFLNEGSVMKDFHDGYHVVKLLGIVSRGMPPLVIMELMDRGDLKSYLRRFRDSSYNITSNEMYRMASEIADGMAYLSAKKYVHRDLAARNCMVGADRTVKIGDFGMARDIYETDYYRVGSERMMPVRWMAPESLKDGVFSTDSDMWSYGVVLWEIASLAEQPYQGRSNEEALHYVIRGGTLSRPSECSDLLYELMSSCWAWRPIERPTFTSMVMKLQDHVGESFRAVAYCFNPPAMLPENDGDVFTQYEAAEGSVSLFVSGRSRPVISPSSNQRYRNNSSSPYQISPGSPSKKNPRNTE